MNKARRYLQGNRSLACATALGATLVGCAPSNTVKAGAPVMLSFGPIAQDGSDVALVTDAGVQPAPPLARFIALFDRLLDPTTLEDLQGNPKAGLVSLQALLVPTPIPLTTNFVPNGDSTFHEYHPAGPSITATPTCGMPSSSAVTAVLDLLKIRSHDQKTSAVALAGAMATVSFTTEPLAFGTDLPPPPMGAPTAPPEVEVGTVVSLMFNNYTPGDPPKPIVKGEEPSAEEKRRAACPVLPSILSHIHVTGSLAGVPIADLVAVIAQDADDASKWTVSPPPAATADEPGAWPVGALITITVDATATDTFAQPSGTEAAASFMVKS
jgi:hypothetical protein